MALGFFTPADIPPPGTTTPGFVLNKVTTPVQRYLTAAEQATQAALNDESRAANIKAVETLTRCLTAVNGVLKPEEGLNKKSEQHNVSDNTPENDASSYGLRN